jgi:methylglutaconyl-CoA hydratase
MNDNEFTARSSGADEILVAAQGAVTTVTLNRPEKRNALNLALLARLSDTIAAAEAEPTRRVLVLRGAGPVFCAGLDLAEAAQPEQAHESAQRVADALRRLSGTRLVTIAAVHGAAMAGGAGLMSACDFAVATQETRLGYPEVHRGLVPGLIMTFLRRQLRERDARELLLLGQTIDAPRALAMGLINRVVADETALNAEVESIALAIARGAPEAVTRTKRLLAQLWPSPVEDDLERALASHIEARNGAEAREGLAAFREKRAPNWART